MTDEALKNKLVSELTMDTKTHRALDRGGIRTVGDLMELDAWELTDIRGLGRGCLLHVVNGLAELGLTLKPSTYFNRR